MRTFVTLLVVVTASCGGPDVTFEIHSHVDGDVISGLTAVQLRVSGQAMVRGAEFYVDGFRIHTDLDVPYECHLEAGALEDGPHEIGASLVTDDGASWRQVTLVVDNLPPEIQIISPLDGVTYAANTGPLLLAAAIEEPAGDAAAAFYLDGVPVASFDGPPYRFLIEPDDMPPDLGQHNERTFRVAATSPTGHRDYANTTFNLEP